MFVFHLLTESSINMMFDSVKKSLRNAHSKSEFALNEVFFARKGYAIDGKRLPSFNRGSVYGLRLSLKLNNIKQKGLTKKDDMIKVLMKL